MQFAPDLSRLVSVPESLALEPQDAIRTVEDVHGAPVRGPATTWPDDMIGNTIGPMAARAGADAASQRTDIAPLLNSARRIGDESSGADI